MFTLYLKYRKWGWFNSMGVAWYVLVVKVWIGVTIKWCSSEHLPWKLWWSSEVASVEQRISLNDVCNMSSLMLQWGFNMVITGTHGIAESQLSAPWTNFMSLVALSCWSKPSSPLFLGKHDKQKRAKMVWIQIFLYCTC